MHLNIAQKIFGIAAVVLALMIVAAVVSIQLTAEISNDLDDIAKRQLPLSDTIGRINVNILEQGILLQQLFALPEDAPKNIARIKTLSEGIDQEFDAALEIFKLEEGGEEPPPSITRLDRALGNVEREYRVFEGHALQLLSHFKEGDNEAFEDVLKDLNKQQGAIDGEIAALHTHMEDVAYQSVQRANHAEKLLLYVNIALTILAAILGVGFAAWVTTMLVGTVRRLVYGTEAVEAGNLDTEVPVTTRDEVGRLTVSFNHMVGGLRMKERIKDTFGKYMDPRLVADLLERPEMINLGGDRREMTVMFIDLKDYTSISERLDPPDLVRMINVFFAQMTAAIAANSGVINDFQGDAVMAYWGPPFTGEDDHAALACKAALEALANFEEFRAALKDELGPLADQVHTDLRIGLSSGPMLVGNIGSTATRKYSVIGDPVNLGSRLEGANKNYGTRVMLGDRCRELAGARIHVRELDLIRVKGKAQPTRVFELLPQAPTRTTFAGGLAAYRAQDWDGAKAAFTRCQTEAPDDPVPAVFLERVAYLEAHPPGSDWDGVWVFTTK